MGAADQPASGSRHVRTAVHIRRVRLCFLECTPLWKLHVFLPVRVFPSAAIKEQWQAGGYRPGSPGDAR